MMKATTLRLLAIFAVTFALLTGCDNNTDKDAEPTPTPTPTPSRAQEPGGVTDKTDDADDPVVPAGYNLVWEDNFDGAELDETVWNRFTAQPGWVNNELQEYTTSTDNAYIEDGKLVIRALKDGGSYTSGRLTTHRKKEYKYGRVEARIKLPEGQGLWPAFWLMPANEGLYGQWPKCGEIDIMEFLGHETSTVHGTLHYGEPHASSQGTYKLASGSFADNYHHFAVEWEPGEIRFYADGELYHTENSWFTKVEGMEKITYPAPFDQPFHVILNLAVGGTWPGNPDDTTDFENAKMYVDYVRWYQKDSYDENVKLKEDDVVFRQPDATGNLIVNGDFSAPDNVDGSENWGFLTAGGGAGKAYLDSGELVVETETDGTEEYSIQIVQPGLPIYKGSTYRLSFDARASAERKAITTISAPDRSWIRYFADTTITLTDKIQPFSFEFTVTSETDPNGRLEFNLGRQGSTETVMISNVRLEEIKKGEDGGESGKPVLPDGNYVYNGAFHSGDDRMGHWAVTPANTPYHVTNTDNVRELTVTVGAPVTLSQGGLSLAQGVGYALTFDIRSNTAGAGKAKIAGAELEFETSTDMTGVKLPFTAAAQTGQGYTLEIVFESEGEYVIDNVRIGEDSLLINGSFASGLVGWVPFVDSSISGAVSYLVDTLSEDSAVVYTIGDTSDIDWKIQLKQEGITLEKGQSYKLTFDAKSTVPRKMKYAFQRDGNRWTGGGDEWLPYSPVMEIDLTASYQTFTLEFTMTEETDIMSMLSYSMGTIGAPITTEHEIFIDNVSLIIVS